MDKETLSKLISLSKQGNQKAKEQLLIYAYTPAFWLCRRLLNDPQLGEEITYRVLKSLANQLDSIQPPSQLHRWLGNTAARLCMKKRGQSLEYIPDTTDASFPSNELSTAQTAQVAQILADSLPEELRICLILSVCCGVPDATIAQMTGYPQEAVATNISEAQQGIVEQMELYQEQGVVFSGSLRVPDLLHNAMVLEADPSAAAAMARMVLPPIPETPVPSPKRPLPIVRILLCVAAALLLVLMLVVWGILRKGGTQQTPEPTEETALATLATQPTTAATEETTQPATEPPTEESTEPPTEETTEETTEPTETTAPTEPKKPTSPGTGGGSQPNPGNGGTGSGGTGSAPTDPPGYNPGQGEDGHTHVFFTRPTGQEATCTRAATIYRICSICQHGIIIDDPDRPALGHDYQVHLVIPPTTASQGYTNYRCTRCGNSYDADYVDPLPAPSTAPPETEPPATEPPVTEPPAATPPQTESPASPPEAEAPAPEA